MLFLRHCIVPLICITYIELGIRGSRLWIIILIAVEVPNNVLDMIWHINTPSAFQCIHRAICIMNKAAPFVPGSNDDMKRGFSRFGRYVVPPHAHKLQVDSCRKYVENQQARKHRKKPACDVCGTSSSDEYHLYLHERYITATHYQIRSGGCRN